MRQRLGSLRSDKSQPKRLPYDSPGFIEVTSTYGANRRSCLIASCSRFGGRRTRVAEALKGDPWKAREPALRYGRPPTLRDSDVRAVCSADTTRRRYAAETGIAPQFRIPAPPEYPVNSVDRGSNSLREFLWLATG